MPDTLPLLMALLDVAPDLAARLGHQWPLVREELAQLVVRADAQPHLPAIVRDVDRLLEQLLDSPAAAATRLILQQHQDTSLRRSASALTHPVAPTQEVGWLTLPILYATDRVWRGGAEPDTWYSSDSADAATWGVVEVSVPTEYRIGQDWGPRWWRLEFRPDPARHIVLRRIEPLVEDAFSRYVRDSLGATGADDLLLFVHGYNVSFPAAVRRAAQIARDLRFAGHTMVFSWPSRAHTLAYTADEATIEASAPYVQAFLELLLTRTDARRVHVVAHSMGSRAVARALERIDPGALPAGAAALGHVVFAAADVDRRVFLQCADAFLARASRCMLYASRRDVALRISKLLHRFPRAGDAGRSLVVRQGLETIDASTADTSLFGLGHSYFSGVRSILGDMHGAILNGLPPEQRFDIVPARARAGAYWKYRN